MRERGEEEEEENEVAYEEEEKGENRNLWTKWQEKEGTSHGILRLKGKQKKIIELFKLKISYKTLPVIYSGYST